MKTGIILYFAGNQTIDADADLVGKAAKTLLPEADRIEIVSGDQGHWDIADAWWTLVSRGMHRVLVKLANYSEEDGLRLAGREMRLAG